MHGPGLDMVRATKLSEMPILPLRNLQLSDREEGHPHSHYNFEINESFRREEDKHSANPNKGEITDVWLEVWKEVTHVKPGRRKSSTGRRKSEGHILARRKVHERKWRTK